LSWNYYVLFVRALLATLFIETPIALLFFKENPLKTMAVVSLCNLFSLTTVWFLLPYVLYENMQYVIAAETLAVLSESLIIRILLSKSYRSALVASIAMNLSSFLVGWFFPSLIFA